MDKVLDAYPGDNVRAVGTTSRPWMRWPASISNSSPRSRRVAATASVSPSGPPTTSSLRPPARSCRTTRGRRRRAPCGCRSRASAGRRCSERRQGEGGELLGQPHQREVAVHRLRLEDPLVGNPARARRSGARVPSAPGRSTCSPRPSATARTAASTGDGPYCAAPRRATAPSRRSPHRRRGRGRPTASPSVQKRRAIASPMMTAGWVSGRSASLNLRPGRILKAPWSVGGSNPLTFEVGCCLS